MIVLYIEHSCLHQRPTTQNGTAVLTSVRGWTADSNPVGSATSPANSFSSTVSIFLALLHPFLRISTKCRRCKSLSLCCRPRPPYMGHWPTPHARACRRARPWTALLQQLSVYRGGFCGCTQSLITHFSQCAFYTCALYINHTRVQTNGLHCFKL